MWMLHVLIYALLYKIGSVCCHECPAKCVCEAAASVQCFGLQSVPSGIAGGVRRLNLGYNNIEEIKGRELSGLPGLEEVILSSCGLEQVEANAFRVQKHLKWLDLQKNKLPIIPRALPSSLKDLNLGHNQIHTLQESALHGLRRLRVLNLQNNLITTVRSSSLSALLKLETLYLDGNKIKAIQGVLRLPVLTWLSLANNKISSLPSAFFSSVQHLKTLDVSSNLLTKLPHNLPEALVHLNLNRNQIKSLKSRDLSRLSDLSTLAVCYNRLVSVDRGLRLPRLTVLELAGNQLRVLPSRLSSNLQKVDCGQNRIQEVTYQHLSGLRQLKHLFLENNTIQQFEPDALKDCVHLTNLALEQNLLSTFPHGLPESLVRLDLKANCITTIQEHALKPLNRLQVLNLRNNRLSSLPAMSLLPRLRTLYLEGNLWNCTCELLKVKRALLTRNVDMSAEFCTEPVHTPLDIWQVYIMAQETCEEQSREFLPESHTVNTDIEEYDDYDL
ncbi:leucine-rich repeat-containing protein 15-like [Silurus asotus]|uniref:Leucine-rich repeat-containing protein 15-like n=1 Tax=Silurus asotus TaxID=30991 RepID=A0AAD5AEY4_SILAS|nr:leucine-rich repeat-containing protein 15-like [Silurus asotus]